MLPAWGPLLLGVLTMLFLCWFMAFERQHQIALYIADPNARLVVLLFSCLIIVAIAAFSALFTATTNKAVIQADRAVELEQANQSLSEAYRMLGTTHQQLEVAYRELETAHATIQKQALTDGLTGLPNHRAIVDQLHKELQRAQRSRRPFSVLFFDGDRFKNVNDTYGHAAGDAALCHIGECAGSALRGGDTLGRFGGEEFVVLLPEADAREASFVAERIRTAVAATPVVTSQEAGNIAVTVSTGLATYPSDGTSEQELLSQADEAMYLAKRLGRNQVRTAEEARHMSADLELMALLQHEEQGKAAEREGITPERLRESYTLRAICSLTILLERRNQGLSAHANAVSDLATAIAAVMELDPKDASRIGMAALLHDIGKVAVPDVLLQKSGPSVSPGTSAAARPCGPGSADPGGQSFPVRPGADGTPPSRALGRLWLSRAVERGRHPPGGAHHRGGRCV